jgi:hypothetical protein
MAAPRYITISMGERLGLYRVAQLTERGFYEVVLEMKKPYNNHEAAQELCDILNQSGRKLLQEVALPPSQPGAVSSVL